jgi:hypothetical protein
MKLVKEHINEIFTEDSDPIHDMSIGSRRLIEKWLKKYKIKKYVINNDMTIDVYGEIYLNHKSIKKFPNYIQFGHIINGYFSVEWCNMKSLRGCPYTISKGNSQYRGDFFCDNNNLTSLKHAPKKITGHFYCKNNAKQFTKEDVLKVCEIDIDNITVSKY